jgi:hypothetical protein
VSGFALAAGEAHCAGRGYGRLDRRPISPLIAMALSTER